MKERACTDEPCSWNTVSWNGVEPARLSKIEFYSEEGKKKAVKGLERRAVPQPPSGERKEKFLLDLLRCQSEMPVALSPFDQTSCNFVSPTPAKPVKRLPASLSSWKDNPPSDPMEALKTDNAEVAYLEGQTQKQSSSLLWHEMRAGRITSSVVHAVLHTNRADPAPSLLSRISCPNPTPLNTAPVKWGRENEQRAIEEYTCAMSDHANLSVSPCGLHLSVKEPYLAASPDAVVDCDCCGQGVVEVKCPYKYRDLPIEEMIIQNDCCLNTDYTLKRSHSFYDQVQHQLLVTGLNYADFVVWTSCGFRVTRVYPDAEWQIRVSPIVKEFWLQHVLPSMMSRSVVDQQSSSHEESLVHCKCGEQDGGDMVGCDNSECKFQWFHWKCVGLTKAPRTRTWFCHDCRPRKRQRKL